MNKKYGYSDHCSLMRYFSSASPAILDKRIFEALHIVYGRRFTPAFDVNLSPVFPHRVVSYCNRLMTHEVYPSTNLRTIRHQFHVNDTQSV